MPAQKNSEMQEISINKRNEVVRGANIYSLSAQKMGNAVYHHVQLNKIYKDERFTIPMSVIRELMGLEKSNSYHTRIRSAMMELASPIELYNVNQLTGMRKKGQQTPWQIAQFLIEPKIIKVGKEQHIEAQMSPTMRILIASSNDGNFTQLVLNTHLSKVKSKHSYILYEYLKSFENFRVMGNKTELTYERLDKMFNPKGNKKYLYFSSFKPLLDRAIIDLNDHTDMHLEITVDKKLKKYYIYRMKNKENQKKKKFNSEYWGEDLLTTV